MTREGRRDDRGQGRRDDRGEGEGMTGTSEGMTKKSDGMTGSRRVPLAVPPTMRGQAAAAETGITSVRNRMTHDTSPGPDPRTVVDGRP